MESARVDRFEARNPPWESRLWYAVYDTKTGIWVTNVDRREAAEASARQWNVLRNK